MPDVSWHASWFQCMLMTPCNAKEMKWWIKIQIDRFSIWIRKDSSFPLCFLGFVAGKKAVNFWKIPTFQQGEDPEAWAPEAQRTNQKRSKLRSVPVPCRFLKAKPTKWSCFVTVHLVHLFLFDFTALCLLFSWFFHNYFLFKVFENMFDPSNLTVPWQCGNVLHDYDMS